MNCRPIVKRKASNYTKENAKGDKESMSDQQILQILEQVHAVITDSHIVYTSGKHGAAYVNKDALYPHTKIISQLCRAMAEPFISDDVEVVIAPVIGGVILSQWVAWHLSEMTGRDVLGVYAEKDGADGFIVKRGYDKALEGKKVLVVEDVVTTGGSVRKVIDAVRKHGGHVVGVGMLCNRGGIKSEAISNPPKLFSLLNIKLDAWEEAECPLCKQGVPINTSVGKGREYLARKRG